MSSPFWATVTPSFSFVVPGHPVGKERTRSAGRRHYTPQKTVDYENAVKRAFNKGRLKWELATGGKWPMDGEFRLAFDCYAQSYTRPDISNILKALEDGLNHVAYNDDRQITKLGETNHKRPDFHNPRTIVYISQHQTQVMVDEERKEVKRERTKWLREQKKKTPKARRKK